MGLTKHQRAIIMGVLIDFHSEQIIDRVNDLICEGYSCKGLYHYTDHELLEEYAWVRGFDCDEEDAKNSRFYQECLAELAVDEVVQNANKSSCSCV